MRSIVVTYQEESFRKKTIQSIIYSLEDVTTILQRHNIIWTLISRIWSQTNPDRLLTSTSNVPNGSSWAPPAPPIEFLKFPLLVVRTLRCGSLESPAGELNIIKLSEDFRRFSLDWCSLQKVVFVVKRYLIKDIVYLLLTAANLFNASVLFLVSSPFVPLRFDREFASPLVAIME